MTTLREIIAQAAPYAKPVDCLDPEIYREWSKYDCYDFADLDGRLTSTYISTISTWYCTDTWVGTEAFYLDGEFVFLTKQQGRKCYKFYDFASTEAFKKVRIYAESFRVPEDLPGPALVDLDAPQPTGYTVAYVSQIIPHMHTSGTHVPTGERFTETPHAVSDSMFMCIVNLASGPTRAALSDLLFDYAGASK